MAISIVSDVEIPEASRASRASKYPFDDLPLHTDENPVAIVIPAAEAPSKGLTSVRAAIYAFRRTNKTDKKFSARQDEEGNIFVWRTV